jgi:hypothetical protein
LSAAGFSPRDWKKDFIYRKIYIYKLGYEDRAQGADPHPPPLYEREDR